METIWKFPIKVTDVQSIPIPEQAKILTVQVQNGQPCVWVQLDPGHAKTGRTIRIAGTGHPLPDAESLLYIGTFQLHGGGLVFHVFESVA